jgi:ABC-type Na+ efflux pump, permease component
VNHLLNITKKELKELLTPGSIISLVVVVIVLMSVGSMMSGEMDDISTPSKIGFVNEDGGPWSDTTIDAVYSFYMGTYDMNLDEAMEFVAFLTAPGTSVSDTEIIEMMKKEGVSYAIKLGPEFSSNLDDEIRGLISEYYLFENKGLLGSASSSISSLIIPYISDYLTSVLVSWEITDPDTAYFILNPIRGNDTHTYVNGEVHAGVTPMNISTSMMGQTLAIPIVIMIVITMIGGIVISSMGNEKENKTLETLLTLPVKRTTIVSGKLLASAIMGLVFGLAYMIGMMSYTSGFTAELSGGTNLADYGLSLDMTDWMLMMIMIFLAIFSALGLCMILGAFVKNYKAAQTMTLPISMMAMIPMFITMFSSWESLPGFVQGILFAIPFSHPMMAMDNLMFNNMDLILGGLIYLAVFVVATIMITVKIYNSDILITGIKQTKLGRTFSWKKN